MPVVAAALGVLVGASCAFWLYAVRCARDVLRRARPRWLAPEPPVSILKPVRGLDAGAAESFASHCEQSYPEFEVLFGFADPRDPAIAIVRELQRRHGTERVRIVIASDEAQNPKAGLLDALAREARHDVLVATDSDVRLPPAALGRITALFADPSVGLVTLPYRGDGIASPGAVLEALGIATSFVPSALVGRRVLRAPFAFGAANAIRRSALERIGGFAALASYLADDYQLGHRVGASGLAVVTGDLVAGCQLGAVSLAAWWQREVRWARTIRTSRPAEYPGLLVTCTTPLALAAGLAGASWWLLAGALAVRWAVAWRMTSWLGARELRRWLPLVPVRDLLAPAIWLAGLAGRRVRWRGRTFALSRDGQLSPVTATPGVAARAIRVLDRLLRERQGIFEVTGDPTCVLRISLPRAHTCELHLWNEQLPRSLLRLPARLGHSLRLLAAFAVADPRLAEVSTFQAELWLSARYSAERLAAMAGRLGFSAELVPADGARTSAWAHRARAFHARLLRHAFAGATATDAEPLRCVRFRITRDDLLAHHLDRAAPGAVPAPLALELVPG